MHNSDKKIKELRRGKRRSFFYHNAQRCFEGNARAVRDHSYSVFGPGIQPGNVKLQGFCWKLSVAPPVTSIVSPTIKSDISVHNANTASATSSGFIARGVPRKVHVDQPVIPCHSSLQAFLNYRWNLQRACLPGLHS